MDDETDPNVLFVRQHSRRYLSVPLTIEEEYVFAEEIAERVRAAQEAAWGDGLDAGVRLMRDAQYTDNPYRKKSD